MRTDNLKKEIKELLIKSKWNRNDDYALYADYILSKLPDEKFSNYYQIMWHHKDYKIFSFKSVERARRWLQREAIEKGDTSILSDKQIKKYRSELEKTYKEEFKK